MTTLRCSDKLRGQTLTPSSCLTPLCKVHKKVYKSVEMGLKWSPVLREDADRAGV